MKESRASSAVLEASAVALHHACFVLGDRRVLSSIDLTVNRGEILAVGGSSGSGKSVLLKVMVGLLRPSCGHVKLFGTDINHFRDWKRVAYVSDRLLRGRTIVPATLAEIVMSGRCARAGTGHRYQAADWIAADQALDVVGLRSLRQQPFRALSPVHQRLALVARALAPHPDLIVLDDPVEELTNKARKYVCEMLVEICRTLGPAIVLTTTEASGLGEFVRNVSLVNGKLIDPVVERRVTALPNSPHSVLP